MGTVVVALEHGFVDDHVVIRIDGRVVLDAGHVTTKNEVGLAGSVATEITGDCLVEVVLPRRQVQNSRYAELGELTYVRVSVVDRALVLTPTVEAPRYV